MALGVSTVFEINSSATSGNVNGGGFNAGNANFLTDGAATSATGNSPVFTSVSYSFVAGDVGAWLYIKSGSNWTPGYYQIASVSAGAATLTASVGTANQINNNLWGANTVAGCATTASPTSATWGIDYSRSNSAVYTASDLTGTTTSCTSATNPFTTQMVGNLIHLTAGTGVTTGWYEIVSVSGNTATLDRSAGASYSSVTYNTGGALSLGSSDNAIFALVTASSAGAPRYFIKGNATYTTNGAITVNAGATAQNAIMEGYFSIRGDRPSISSGNQPTLSNGANNLTLSAESSIYNITVLGTGTAVVLLNAAGAAAYSCKVINSSTTASRTAIQCASSARGIFFCDCCSYRGYATVMNSNNVIQGSYIHDSSSGIRVVNTAIGPIINNIIAGCTSSALDGSASAIIYAQVNNNTFYGAENKLGTGVNLSTGTTLVNLTNNIFYGFSTAVSHADTNTIGYDDYNDYYNNTNDVNASGKWQKGTNDVALDPQFTSVAQVTGSGATSSSSTLTDSGKNFTTAGVVAGRDFLYVTSATGVTVGVYGISSVGTTTLTTDISLGSGSSIVYQITTGRNFAIGTNLKALGAPGVFPSAYTTGYLDLGAVQRQEAGGTGSGSFTFS